MSHGGNAPKYLNIASAVAASLVLGAIVSIALYRKSLASRVSFRLQAAIAISDIINHITGLYYTTANPGPNCVAAGFFRTFGRDLFCFYNIAIAFNLQYTYIHGYAPNSRHELYLWIFPLLVSLAMNVIPLGLGMFGKGPIDHSCFIVSSAESKWLKLINVNVVIIMTFVYCFIVTLLVIVRLFSNKEEMGPRKMQNQLKTIVFRIALYPLVSFIVLSGYCVLHLMLLVHNNMRLIPLSIVNWSIYSSNLAGTLNFLAFLFDPSLHYALDMILDPGYSQKLNVATSKDFEANRIESQPAPCIPFDDEALTYKDANNLFDDEACRLLIRRF